MIRAESNNKMSLFGLFGNGIFIPQIPAVLPFLAVVQRWTPSANEPYGMRFIFSFRVRRGALDLIILPESEIVVPPPPGPLMNIAFQIQGFPVAEQGNYEIVTFINNVESF